MRSMLMSLVVLAAPAVAHADGDEPVVSGSANVSVSVPGGGAPVTPGEHVVVPPKRLYVHANLAFGMVKVTDLAGDDSTENVLALQPDIYYGVNSKLTIGLIHSDQAKTGFMGGFLSSLCLTGDLCDDVYNG